MTLPQDKHTIGKIGVITAAYLMTLHHNYELGYRAPAAARTLMGRLTAQLWFHARQLTPPRAEREIQTAAASGMADLFEVPLEDRALLCAARVCDAAAGVGLHGDMDPAEVAKHLFCLATYNNFWLNRVFTPPPHSPLVRPLTSREHLYFEFLYHMGWEALFKEINADVRATHPHQWQDMQRRLQRRTELAPPPTQTERAVVDAYRRDLAKVTSEAHWMSISMETIAGTFVPYDASYTAWTADSCLEALIECHLRILS